MPAPRLRLLIVPLLLCAGLLAARAAPAQPGFRLALLGDVMLGRGVGQAYPDGDYRPALAGLSAALGPAGLAAANLESPLTRQPFAGRSYDLRADPRAAAALSAAGLDLVTLANNHALDGGPAGLAESRRLLQAAGIAGLGPYPETFVYRAPNGLRLAFIALDDVSGLLDVVAAAQAVRAARRAGAQVIVSIHWGLEYQGGASPRQRRLAAELARAGAAVIWGHGPHVTQPAEWQEAGEGRRTLVLYSLGNALFDQPGLPAVQRGSLALVEFTPAGVRLAVLLPVEIDALGGAARLGQALP